MPRKLSRIKCSLFQSIDVCLLRTPIFIILCEVDRFFPLFLPTGLIIEEHLGERILRIYLVVFREAEINRWDTCRRERKGETCSIRLQLYMVVRDGERSEPHFTNIAIRP